MENTETNNTGKWFFFTILYLILDYGRPQDLISLGFLRPGMISVLVLMYYVVANRSKISFLGTPINMMWIFIFWMAILIPFAVNTRSAFNTTQTMLIYMPFILSITGLVDSVDKLKKLIFICVLIMGYVSLYGLLHKGVGSGNYFGDENDLSHYIDMWLPFCYFMLFQEQSRAKRIIYGLCLVAGVLCVVVSFSRGGFVGLVCMIMVVWWFSSKKLLSLIVFCLLAVMVYFVGGEQYMFRISSTTQTGEGTALIRILSWKSAWAMFLDHPFGVGGNNFQYLFSDYRVEGLDKSMWGRAAHSAWFTLIPELGIPGIIIYFMLLWYMIKSSFFLNRIEPVNDDLKYVQTLSHAFLASLAGFVASASFISVLYYPHFWYMVAIVVATVNIARTTAIKSTSQISETRGK